MKPSKKTISFYRSLIVSYTILCLILFIVSQIRFSGRMVFDDAFMFLRYAKHWLASYGFSWNIDEGPVYGCTSALYLFIVTFLRGLFKVPDLIILGTVPVVSGLLSSVLLTGAGFILITNRFLKQTWVPLLIFPTMVISDTFRYHSLSGMETMTALLCNTILICSILVYSRQPRIRFFILCIVIAYFAFLIRPENGIYSLLFPPLFFVANDKTKTKQALLYAGIFIVVLLLDSFIKKMIFGDFIPLPFFAKTHGFYRGYLGVTVFNTARFFLKFLEQSMPFLLVILCFSNKKSAPTLLALLSPVVLLILYLFTVTQIMGFTARFYFPSLPFLVIAAIIACNSYFNEENQKEFKPLHSAPLRFLCISMIIFLVGSSTVKRRAASLWSRFTMRETAQFNAQTQYFTPYGEKLPYLGGRKIFKEMTDFLSALPRDITFAASEYGFIGASLPDLKIIDLVGLNDRDMAHAGFSVEKFFSKKPDIIWMPHKDYTYIQSEVLDNPFFKDHYAYYPKIFILGIAVYKESPSYKIILSALERKFSKLYPGIDFSECLAGDGNVTED